MSTCSNRVAAGEELKGLAGYAARMISELFDQRGCTVWLGDARGTTSRTNPVETEPLVRISAGDVAVAVSESDEGLRVPDRELLTALVTTLAGALEQTRLEHEAREAQLALQLSRSRAGLVSAVSHNLRTPLASIRTATATLRAPDASLTASDRTELLDIVADETERLERMVAKTLDLSRIRAGGLQLQPQTVDLADVAAAAVRRLRPLVGRHVVRLAFDPELKPVTIDVGMIEDVLLNLLENALGFSPAGSEIVIEASSSGGVLEVRVSDHGPGVPPHERDQVFEAFVRGEARTDTQGTGLGLAIVRSHITAHAGQVWVDDTPGGGATFVIRLPHAYPA